MSSSAPFKRPRARARSRAPRRPPATTKVSVGWRGRSARGRRSGGAALMRSGSAGAWRARAPRPGR
jgi:hypothetical protein